MAGLRRTLAVLAVLAAVLALLAVSSAPASSAASVRRTHSSSLAPPKAPAKRREAAAAAKKSREAAAQKKKAAAASKKAAATAKAKAEALKKEAARHRAAEARDRQAAAKDKAAKAKADKLHAKHKKEEAAKKTRVEKLRGGVKADEKRVADTKRADAARKAGSAAKAAKKSEEDDSVDLGGAARGPLGRKELKGAATQYPKAGTTLWHNGKKVRVPVIDEREGETAEPAVTTDSSNPTLVVGENKGDECAQDCRANAAAGDDEGFDHTPQTVESLGSVPEQLKGVEQQAGGKTGAPKQQQQQQQQQQQTQQPEAQQVLDQLAQHRSGEQALAQEDASQAVQQLQQRQHSLEQAVQKHNAEVKGDAVDLQRVQAEQAEERDAAAVQSATRQMVGQVHDSMVARQAQDPSEGAHARAARDVERQLLDAQAHSHSDRLGSGLNLLAHASLDTVSPYTKDPPPPPAPMSAEDRVNAEFEKQLQESENDAAMLKKQIMMTRLQIESIDAKDRANDAGLVSNFYAAVDVDEETTDDLGAIDEPSDSSGRPLRYNIQNRIKHEQARQELINRPAPSDKTPEALAALKKLRELIHT